MSIDIGVEEGQRKDGWERRECGDDDWQESIEEHIVDTTQHRTTQED